jgi:hypothetical protein
LTLFTQTFNGITPDKFAALATKVKAATGIVITSNQGKGTSNGYSFEWNFNPTTNILLLDCLDKPKVVFEWALKKKLSSIIGSL